jgi:hypothetical protein
MDMFTFHNLLPYLVLLRQMELVELADVAKLGRPPGAGEAGERFQVIIRSVLMCGRLIEQQTVG